MLVQADQLKSVYREVIIQLGGTDEEARVFADMYVIADVRGMEWQGIKSLHRYVIHPIQEGITRLRQQLRVEMEGTSSSVVEANGELGQVTCKQAMESAVAKAMESGCGAVVVRNSGDTGLLAGYTMLALEKDCIGVMFNDTYAFVAPWGGAERMHGIDPLSVAIPAGDEYPILVDMALTRTQPTFDKDEIQLPPFPLPPLMHFESLREYALTVVVELMSGGLAGMLLGRDKPRRWEAGVFAMALHIPHFLDVDVFRQRVDDYIRQVRTTKAANGQVIQLPGERGFRTQEERLRDGIPVPDEVWQHVCEVAEDLGVDWRSAIRR